MTLKVYSDRAYLPEGLPHVELLIPFWGKNMTDPTSAETDIFDHYWETGQKRIQFTSLEEADYAALPAQWNLIREYPQAERFLDKARSVGKPILLFYWCDFDDEIPVNDSLILRTSFNRSTRKPNEFAMPAWSKDFGLRYPGGEIVPREKRDKPIVGFCGHIHAFHHMPLKQYVRYRLGVLKRFLLTGKYSHHDFFARASALRWLRSSAHVETNFIIRDHFWAQETRTEDGDTDHAKAARLREEYFQNIVESDYILVARGSGNFSYRLYETLSAGRIPVFVDSDCVLPFDFEVDWKQYCVWIDQKDIRHIGRKVAEFHNALSPQEFINLQKDCRRFWEQRLSPEGFFGNLYRIAERLHYHDSNVT